MISPVDPYLEAFAEAGADGLTVHPEAGPHVHRTLQHIRKLGKKAGVVLNPGTPVDALDNLMDLVDLILVMSVNPGFGGQSFIESQLQEDRSGAQAHRRDRPRHRAGSGWRHHAGNRQARHRRRRHRAGGGHRRVPGRAVAICRQYRRPERLTVQAERAPAAPAGTDRGRAAPRCRRRCASWWRRNWFYRRLLQGPAGRSYRVSSLGCGAAPAGRSRRLLRGRFRFHGVTVDVPDGVSVFDLHAAQRRPGMTALHSFAWLPALSNAGGDNARKLATNLIGQWVKRHGAYSEPVWLPHIMARRLAAIFSHGRLVILNSEMMWRSRLFVSLREQCRMLERICARSARRPAAAGSGRGAGAVGPVPGRQSQAARDRACAAGRRNRAPDPARWRPCQPLARSAAVGLSPCHHGDGSAERGGRGAAACLAQRP